MTVDLVEREDVVEEGSIGRGHQRPEGTSAVRNGTSDRAL
jgi:hypothetical protein